MDLTQIYKSIRCSKCKHRLKEPYELKCQHLICRDCLTTILQNHRTSARCPFCQKALGEYQIENYSFLPVKHPISKLLSSFTDVNECQTCQEFTMVEACIQCCADQCDNCRDKHEVTHQQPRRQISAQFDELSKEEMTLLEAIRKELTETEFADLVTVARTYLNSAVTKGNGTNHTLNQTTTTTTTTTPTTTATKLERKVFSAEETSYDWSKHPKFTAAEIGNSSPGHVRELLRLNFTPRPYQIRMIGPSLRKQNSLVCLQTGAGKTYLAGLVAKCFHILSLPSVNPSSPRRFKAVFLVPIKALVDQQCDAFRRVFIDQPDSILKTIDTQAGERFDFLYAHYDIFFFTVQKFANFVEGKYADLTKFDLIMIDECHHCYDNHPINSMMRQYHRLKRLGASIPQIIALTGSVGTNKKNAFKHLVHLCANLDCFEVCAIQRGPEEDELRQSTNTPLADTIVTVSKEDNDPIISNLRDDVMKSIALRLGFDITTMDNQKLEQFLVDENRRAATENDHDAIIGTDYLRKLNRFWLYYIDLPLSQCMKWLEESLDECMATVMTPFDNFCWRKLNEFRECATLVISNPGPLRLKLRKLIDMILGLHTSNSRGLVLVRTKFHTVALEEFLNHQPELQENRIVVGHLTGQGSAEELSLPGNQQAAVLKEFRAGTKNLLVATDVAQEGIDVAECSYVIRYEFVSNEIGSVQSRGRARAVQSRCFLLTEALSSNYQRENENRAREAEMKEAIVELRKRGPEEFEELVRKEQAELEKGLLTMDSPSTARSASTTHRAAKAIHCRFCNAYLCKGSSLRLQGSTIVCIDPDFEARVKPPKVSGEKIVCSEASCHREIGAVILLQRDVPGYVLQITALKFYFLNEEEPQIFKKWSVYRERTDVLSL